MTVQQMFDTFVSEIGNTRWQEWLSTMAQIASVWYAKKNNILIYPTGIVGVLLAAYVYYWLADPPLYADAILNVYYFFMSVYGWYYWSKKQDILTDAYPISWCNHRQRLYGLVFFAVSWAAIYAILHWMTDSNTPILDALVSSSALTAMYWMAKRKIENWPAWIFSNLVAIPLNFYKGFMLFTLMYVLFLVLAWLGYKSWKQSVPIA